MKKVLFAAFISIVLAILPIYEVFADDHDLTITRSDSSSAVEGDDYSWDTDDTNKLIIKTNDLIVTGTTVNEYIVLNAGVTSLTINSLNIDLSSSSQTAIESLNESDVVTIAVSGTNNITVGEVDDTEIDGIKAAKLKLLGDGKLYIRAGHTHYKHRAIHTNLYFETSVSFLYLNAYNGIWVEEESDNGGSIKINEGDVYILSDNDGIISTYYKSDMIIDDANVNIYSGLSGILVGNLTLNNDSQLIIQIEDYNGANNNNTIYTQNQLTLSDDASMYLTHCGGGYTNVHFAKGVVLPVGKKLKGCYRALGRPEECTDIEEDISSEFRMDWENIQYTVVYGNPTRVQSKSIDFKTKVLSDSSVEISGLEVPNISLGNLPEGRWYYLTKIEYYEGSQLSCLEEPYCLASDEYSGCRYHRMGYIAEGHATVMPSLQELEVNNGKATITGLNFTTYPYIAIVYAIEDTITCPGSENLAHLSYGVGLTEIEDTTVGAENDDANFLKPDATGKIKDRLPSSWCGEWELDTIDISHSDDDNFIYTSNTYHIGTDFNGTKRTKGDSILTVNKDGAYSLTGLINSSGTVEYIDREDDPGMSITIDEKIFIIYCGTEYINDDEGNTYEYDKLQLTYGEYNDTGSVYDRITYYFAKSDAPRVNVSYGEENISLLIGSRLWTTDLPSLTKTGYVFAGCFSDSDCIMPFMDLDNLFENLIIYPKWINTSTDSYLTHAYGTFTVNGSTPGFGSVELYYGNETIASCDVYETSSFSLDFARAITPGEYQMYFCDYGDYPNIYTRYYLVNITSENLGNFNLDNFVGDYGIYNYGFYPMSIDGFDDYRLEGAENLVYEIDYGEILDTADSNVITILNEMDSEAENKQFFFVETYHMNMDYEEREQIYGTGTHVLVYKLSYPTNNLNDITLYRTVPSSGTVETLTKLDSKPTSNYQDGTYYVGDNCIYFYSSEFDVYGISSNNKVEYTMEEKPSEPINTDNNQDVVFKSVAPYSKFFNGDNIIGSVKVDGNIIDSINYSHEEGSTKITLKSSYLSTLSVGEHTMEIVSTDGSAISSFTITRSNTPTPTPDPGHNHSDNRHIVLNTGIN